MAAEHRPARTARAPGRGAGWPRQLTNIAPLITLLFLVAVFAR